MEKITHSLALFVLAGLAVANAQVAGQFPDCQSCFPPAGTPMVVTNNTFFPVWTRNVDEMTPVQAFVRLSMGGDLQKSAVLFTVPLGKRLVITKVGTDGERSQGQRTHLSLLTTVEGTQTAVPFPMKARYSTSIGSTAPAMIHADGGTQVIAHASRPEVVGPWLTNIDVSITGYLVNK